MGRKWKQKFGSCNLFPNGKTKYRGIAVADHDRRLMESRFPGEAFEVFRCKCGYWHVGRPG